MQWRQEGQRQHVPGQRQARRQDPREGDPDQLHPRGCPGGGHRGQGAEGRRLMRAGTATGVRRTAVAVLLVLVPSLASATAPPATTQGGPRKPAASAPEGGGPDVFGGYSYTHAGEANLNG